MGYTIKNGKVVRDKQCRSKSRKRFGHQRRCRALGGDV